MWINDCSWLDEPEDLEDLTDERLIQGIERHYERFFVLSPETGEFLSTNILC